MHPRFCHELDINTRAQTSEQVVICHTGLPLSLLRSEVHSSKRQIHVLKKEHKFYGSDQTLQPQTKINVVLSMATMFDLEKEKYTDILVGI